MKLFRLYKTANKDESAGFVQATIITFIPLVFILSVLALSVSMQTYLTSLRQDATKQAQLASVAAMEYAKEQYELDIDYMGTPETLLYSTDRYDIRYEVVHKGFSNALNTQQDIQGVGRVYEVGTTDLVAEREIQGKITYSPGSGSSVRFIFIIDNSWSMSTAEWLESKTTVDAAITFVINNSPSAEVAVVQYGTHYTTYEHKYDVTVSFTRDIPTATTWDRKYGHGSASYYDGQDHLPGSLARMRLESVYGPGDELDLNGATDVQYVLFTDAWGDGLPSGNCCSHLKYIPTDPPSWFNGNASGFSVLEGHGEYNALKDGTVFAEDGYSGLTSQFTVLNINQDTDTIAIAAAIASPGGSWTGAVDPNPGDPEGDGIIPRRFISTTLSAGPAEILSLLQEVIDEEINF